MKKKYAFRAVVNEDKNWLHNNPRDSSCLIDLVSFAEAALNDREFAIAQEQWVLNHLNRAEDDEEYDREMDRLSADLDDRGRSQEALKLLDELVRRLGCDQRTPLNGLPGLNLREIQRYLPHQTRSRELRTHLRCFYEY